MPIILTPSSPPTTDEAWVLDGLDFNSTPWRVERLTRTLPAQRQTWLESPDEDGALLLEDPKVGNAELVFRMRLSEAATDMDASLNFIKDLELKLSECSATRGGIDLVWTPKSSTHSATIKALAGEITELPITNRDDDLGWFIRRPVLTFKLTAEPYGELEEVTGPTVTNDDEVQILIADAVPGTAPARPRLVVTDTAGVARRHLEIGIETNRSYDFADGDLLIPAADLVETGFAGLPGTLTTTPVTLCSTGDLKHVGGFRVKASALYNPTSSPVDVFARLSWREGDGPLRSNDWVSVFASDPDYCELDLGTVNIPSAKQGAQKWEGRIDAYSVAAGDTLDVRHLILAPTSVRYGKGRAPSRLGVPTAFSARDEFDQAAGALAGKTLPIGGTWAGAGDADDFATSGSSAFVLQRTAINDSAAGLALKNGRFAIAGSALTDMAVRTDFGVDTPVAGLRGVFARYIDIDNWLVVGASQTNPGSGWIWTLTVVKCVAGTETVVMPGGQALNTTVPAPGSTTTTATLAVLVDASGHVSVYLDSVGREPSLQVRLSDADLATGGALASGKGGIWDWHPSASVATRTYDNFAVWVPAPEDAVIFPNRSAEVTNKVSLRENAGGTYWGQIAPWRGRFPTIPPAGDKDISTRLLVKARANDVEIEADDSTYEEITATLFYTPRVKVVP